MYERFKRSIQPLINIYHLLKAFFANILYGFPSKKLKVIGVTGTDGKTTTTFLIYHILKAAGKKVSMITSVYAKIGDREYDTGLHTTTPDAVLVQRMLKKALVAGDEYFVLETTSHALDQNRVTGVTFDIGVITNITSEHLDYHRTRDKYIKAKSKLLTHSKTSVINRDDSSFLPLTKILERHKKTVITYSLKTKAVYTKNIKKDLNLPLAEFNNYNYLAAYAVSDLLGINKKTIENAMKNYVLPKGRLETVYDKEFRVIIDFAHTENSIRLALKSIKSFVKGGRLIHVFGAAGLRDRIKRPLMGEASAESSDVVILTEEDHRTEDPVKISEEVAAGLVNKGFGYVYPEKLDGTKKRYTVIVERNKAIQKAVDIAQKGDVIVLTGKSHERSLARGNKEYPWDEKRTLLEVLAKKS